MQSAVEATFPLIFKGKIYLLTLSLGNFLKKKFEPPWPEQIQRVPATFEVGISAEIMTNIYYDDGGFVYDN